MYTFSRLIRKLFLVVEDIVEGGADGSTVLGMLGNVEAYVVEFLQGGEHFLALGKLRQFADEHEARLSLLSKQYALIDSQIQLYKALGGELLTK